MSPGRERRPAGETGGAVNPDKKFNASVAHLDDMHGAELALDAAAWWNALCWAQAVERAARSGGEFCADDLQMKYDLPDIGNAVGGIFMRAHRAGTIHRVGYRPSRKRSRAGSVVAVWAGDRR